MFTWWTIKQSKEITLKTIERHKNAPSIDNTLNNITCFAAIFQSSERMEVKNVPRLLENADYAVHVG